MHVSINGVDVALGSTVFFQAQQDQAMTVSTLEGHATLRTAYGTQTAYAGTRVSIAMDSGLNPIQAPSSPSGYDQAQMESLPIRLLEREIVVTPPLTPEQIVQLPTDCSPLCGVRSLPDLGRSTAPEVTLNHRLNGAMTSQPVGGGQQNPNTVQPAQPQQGSINPPAGDHGGQGADNPGGQGAGNCGNGNGNGQGNGCRDGRGRNG